MVNADVQSAFSADQTSTSAAAKSGASNRPPSMPAAAKAPGASNAQPPSSAAAAAKGPGASEHTTRGTLADALNRTLSWDLPQPPRRKERIRQNISNLHPPASAPLNEDGLPTPEPFKVKMVETIT